MNASDLKKESGKNRRLGWFEIIFALGIPLPTAFVLFCIFDIIYLGMESVFGLVMMIMTVLGYLLAFFLLLRFFRKPTPPSPSGLSAGSGITSCKKDSDSGSEVASSFAAGVLGGMLLDHAIRKHSSEDKNDNDFLWQEKIRRDM